MTSFILTIDIDLPAADVSAAIRRAVGFMAEDIDPDGQRELTIDVHDNVGNLVTGHFYDPTEV